MPGTITDWKTSLANNEWGDFQTPEELVEEVVRSLPHEKWSRILEPTCGTGTFLRSVSLPRSAEFIGIEQNANYAAQAGGSGEIIQRNIFDLNLSRDLPWKHAGPLLVIGNPPWVTNSELSSLRSINRPERRNLKNLSGFDALTGASNFDIAEYIWLKLIVELQDDSPTIAMLCKTHVARNVLSYCAQFGIGLKGASIRRIDAKRWFNASVDACLFTVEVAGDDSSPECLVYSDLDSSKPEMRIGVVDGALVSDTVAYKATRAADGHSPVDWRQGVKHDAASVMELRSIGGKLENGLGEPVDVETEFVFPLLKCTDVYKGTPVGRRSVIVPQRHLGDDTSSLASTAPKLWAYLNQHSAALDGRKSSIYTGRPRFSVFGIGPYSFAPYKIAISGLHKEPRFRLVGPSSDKPVMFDDTCYLLPFNDAEEALAVYGLLTSQVALSLLESLVFWDAKRPITKKLLSRLDLQVIMQILDEKTLIESSAPALLNLGVRTQHDWTKTFARLRRDWSSTDNGRAIRKAASTPTTLFPVTLF